MTGTHRRLATLHLPRGAGVPPAKAVRGRTASWRFVQTKDGEPNCALAQWGSHMGPVAVQVDACQGHAGLSFVNGQFMATVKVAGTDHGPVPRIRRLHGQ